jgi:acyl transferase domain-containing protein
MDARASGEAMGGRLEEFLQIAKAVSYGSPTVSMVSSLSGQLGGAELASPGYWARQLSETAQFARSVQTLRQIDVDVFLELGPRPELVGLVSEALPAAPVSLLASLRGDGADENAVLLEALGRWSVLGGTVDWKAAFPASARRVELPTYPWQRQRYWIDGTLKGA